MILDSTGKISPDSGFHEKNFSDSGIRIPLHWAICTWVYTKGLGTAESVEPVDATQQGYSSSPQMTAHVDLQHFTSNDVHTPARCSLQAPGRDYRLLCGIFRRKSWSATSSMSSTSMYSCRSVFRDQFIFRTANLFKPVCKTYRPESSIFFHITTFSWK